MFEAEQALDNVRMRWRFVPTGDGGEKCQREFPHLTRQRRTCGCRVSPLQRGSSWTIWRYYALGNDLNQFVIGYVGRSDLFARPTLPALTTFSNSDFISSFDYADGQKSKAFFIRV